MTNEVRAYLSPDIHLTGHKTKHGFSLTAVRGDKKCSLFISDGNPVCHKSAAVSLEHFL